jgi:ABC-2 type transport system ATP-binding protein
MEIVQKLCTHVGIIMHGKLVLQSSMHDILAEGSLESRFLAMAGADSTGASKLDWLENR